MQWYGELVTPCNHVKLFYYIYTYLIDVVFYFFVMTKNEIFARIVLVLDRMEQRINDFEKQEVELHLKQRRIENDNNDFRIKHVTKHPEKVS